MAAWTDANLRGKDGATYYQCSGRRVDRRHFVRWGDAHVALGESALLLLDRGVQPPLEAEVARGSQP